MTDAVKGRTTSEALALFDRVHAMFTTPIDQPIDADSVGKLAVLAGVREFPMRVKCASLVLAHAQGRDLGHPGRREDRIEQQAARTVSSGATDLGCRPSGSTTREQRARARDAVRATRRRASHRRRSVDPRSAGRCAKSSSRIASSSSRTKPRPDMPPEIWPER